MKAPNQACGRAWLAAEALELGDERLHVEEPQLGAGCRSLGAPRSEDQTRTPTLLTWLKWIADLSKSSMVIDLKEKSSIELLKSS